MTSRMVVSFASVLALGTVLSCASAPPKESTVGGSSDAAPSSEHADASHRDRASPYEDAAANAAANTCEDRPCYSNSDCCAGASCGFDPERSHVQRYCLGM